MGRKDPLEKAMTTHSRILAWEIPWIEEPGHGILQARILEWVVIPFFRDQTRVRFFMA